MKVLNNMMKNIPLIIKCDYCNSELEIEDGDITVGAYGCARVKCPVCDHDLLLCDYEDGDRWDVEVDVDNVKFPDYFHHTCTENDAIDVSSEEIEKEIGEGVAWFRRNPDRWHWMTQHGNLTMHMYNYPGDGEFYVVVSKDYYDTFLKYKPKDYEIFEYEENE